ncbi:MAG: 4-alpha-glucanotransferase [Elainellaceae cyanobacterium]
MPFPRTSGLLLHPTSFPTRFGMGDVGGAAYQFIDFLCETQQKIWQVLPLGPTGHGNSPYMSYSSMAGNPMLINLDQLRDKGLLEESDFGDLPQFSEDTVDYDGAATVKIPLLRKAADTFGAQASPEDRQAFETFCQERQFWLNDYAFFMALKDAHDGKSWTQWDRAIAKREPEALSQWREKLATKIFRHKYWQFEFHNQWCDLKRYANERGISIVGDMPFYVAHDSADVWELPNIFCLNEESGEPSLMAGVPPDYFSETGQLWGNPIYNWQAMQEWGYKWWMQRFQALLEYVDIIRIDHFRGFQAYWEVQGGETTAMNGHWVEAPGEELFHTLEATLGELPIIAEDLGVITPEVEALRDKFEFPGMKILQFAFGSGSDNPYLPFNYTQNCLVYTGTHDNNTTVGWFYETLSDHERGAVVNYLGHISPYGIHWDMIRLALSSVANQAIIPLQDVLGLGTEARMNLPGKPSENWNWRYRPEALTQELGDRLRNLTVTYGRA